MRSIKLLKQDIEAKIKELGEMRSKCKLENRDPNPDEIVGAQKLMSEIDHLEDLIKLEARSQATLERVRKSETTPDQAALDSELETRSIEQRGGSEFASIGEFLVAVMQAGTPNQPVDQRLSTRAASGMSEGIPSDGGFLVDRVLANQVMENVWSMGEIMPRINKITLSGNKNAMTINGFDETSRATGSRWGGIMAYWESEAGEYTGSKPKFRKIDLKLKKLIGLCYATDELLDDAQALEQALTTGFTGEFNFMIQNAIINGTGAGQPLGLINAGCLVEVAKESGQDADTIVYDNVLNMWSRLMASSRPNSIWCINQNCEPQLNKLSLPVGTGGVPVYLPTGGAAVAPYATLMNRPVVPIEQCPVLGDKGDIILADFTQYQAIDKGMMQKQVSIHVRFLYDEQVFKFTYRFDGEPMLGSAITPFTAGSTTATDTLSHFVTLAERA